MLRGARPGPLLTVLMLILLPMGVLAPARAGEERASAETAPSPLRLTPGHSVVDFVVSPDGSRAVYTVFNNTRTYCELWSVDLAGGSPVRLDSAEPDVFVECAPPLVTSDSPTVVFSTVHEVTSERHIVTVPIGGGAATELTPNMGFQSALRLSPDEQWVVFMTEAVFSVPLDGGAVTQLSGEPVEDGERPGEYLISPDSSRVVYRGQEDTAGVYELYAVPIAGGAQYKLSGPMGHPDGDVEQLPLPDERDVFTADSSFVIYQADANSYDNVELFSVPLQGGTAVRLNSNIPDVTVSMHGIAAGNRVVFSASHGCPCDIFSVPVEGGTPKLLNRPLEPGDGVHFVGLTPDGTAVMYAEERPAWSGNETLFRVAAGGGAGTRLHAGSNLRILAFMPDSEAFIVDGGVWPASKWSLVNVADGAETPLPGEATRCIHTEDCPVLSESADHLIFEEDTSGGSALHALPLTGAASIPLGGPTATSQVVGIAVVPGQNRVVYKADETVADRFELYLTELASLDNSPPRADAGLDQVIEWSGGNIAVTLDGSGSSDPDGDTLSYSWSGGFVEGSATGVKPTVTFNDLGDVAVTLTVDDDRGGTDSDSVIISLAAYCEGRPATITGTLGNDLLIGTPSADVIVALGGNDVVHAEGGNDVVCGGPGADRLRGQGGHDTMNGNDGFDLIVGGGGRDVLIGSDGDDLLKGQGGKDTLFGGGGDDRLFGGGNTDRLSGGAGTDYAHGGGATDQCSAETTVACE